MIMAAILPLAVGILAGLSVDGLLRGRDPRSASVVAWGLWGGLGGAGTGYSFGAKDLLIGALSAAVGGMVFALAARARISARLERSARNVSAPENPGHADNEGPVVPINARFAREEVEVSLLIASDGITGAGQQGHVPRPARPGLSNS